MEKFERRARESYVLLIVRKTSTTDELLKFKVFKAQPYPQCAH